ncbi:hypothetical protein AB0B51_04565, partial [Streptomyces griseus]
MTGDMRGDGRAAGGRDARGGPEPAGVPAPTTGPRRARDRATGAGATGRGVTRRRLTAPDEDEDFDASYDALPAPTTSA